MNLLNAGTDYMPLKRKKTAHLLGYTGFHNIPFDVDFAPGVEIGWRIKYEDWNMGYATEAAKACLLYAKEYRLFQTIWSFTSLPNKSSERVMQKIGMTKVKEFPHPAVSDHHPLKEHVLYKMVIE